MKPAPFEYAAPETLAEVVSLLRQYDGEAKIIAGGQSLVPMLNMRLARPELLVDLANVSGLEGIREADGGLAIGAMTTKRSIERSKLVARKQPLFHAATCLIAHPQIRSRGTVGGSMAQADPAAEYPAAAVALDAELVVTGPDGTRTIPAAQFFITYLTTALDSAEVLTEIRLPARPAGEGWSIQEVARRHGDFAIAGVATSLTPNGNRGAASARIVFFGVDAVPVRAERAEALVVERGGLDPGVFEAAGDAAAEELTDPIADVHASADYRRDLARTLTRRSLAEAAARTEGT